MFLLLFSCHSVNPLNNLEVSEYLISYKLKPSNIPKNKKLIKSFSNIYVSQKSVITHIFQ